MASWNIKAPYYTDSEKKEAVFNYMSGKMTSQQTISEFGLADSTLRKYVKEVKDRLHECNHNLFPADFSSMNVTQIAKKYFSVDDKGLYIDKERSELIYLSVLAMNEDGRSVQRYFSDMEVLVAVKALASEEKMNLGISHNNATRTAFLNNLIKVKGQMALVKEGEERSRLLALRKSQLLKLKELIQDKESLESIDPEEAFEWHLDAMLVANIRDLYRACTTHTNIAYFNGVTKSVANAVSKNECIAYIIQITEQDMKGELGDGNDKDGVLQNDEDGELEEDEEDEEDGMGL